MAARAGPGAAGPPVDVIDFSREEVGDICGTAPLRRLGLGAAAERLEARIAAVDGRPVGAQARGAASAPAAPPSGS